MKIRPRTLQALFVLFLIATAAACLSIDFLVDKRIGSTIGVASSVLFVVILERIRARKMSNSEIMDRDAWSEVFEHAGSKFDMLVLAFFAKLAVFVVVLSSVHAPEETLSRDQLAIMAALAIDVAAILIFMFRTISLDN